MDLLKREMERKKKALQDAKKRSGNGGSRFVKASELRRLMEENADNEKCAEAAAAAAADSATERQNDNTLDKKRENRKGEEETSTTAKPEHLKDDTSDHVRDANANANANAIDAKELKQPDQLQLQQLPPAKKRKKDQNKNKNDAAISSADKVAAVLNQQQQQSVSSSLSLLPLPPPLDQVQRELRSLGVPVTLFGENSVSDRVHRWQAAVRTRAARQLNETEADEFRLGQGHGIRNPFLEKEDENDATYTTDIIAKAAAAAADLVQPGQEAAKEKSHKEMIREKKELEESNDNDDDPYKRVYRHFKGLLKQWEADVNDRPDDVKRSLAGRNERKTVKQCKDYIRPLFQLCKRRQLEENLLNKLFDMVQCCEQGEFVKAHDAYMDVAIGRAAWPIGVTMVGIHARTGRAKIESSNVAHVMNSELQRKYLTSVKRLLTYEQTKRTDVDPSKKVMN